MNEIIYDEILPVFIFFIVFSIIFLILELIVVIFLDYMEKKYWKWMIDVVIRNKVYHGRLLKYGILILICLFFIALITFTPLTSALSDSSEGFKIFSVLLALVMLLIYLISIRRSSKIHTERMIYGIIFFAISLPFYFSVIIFAQKSYEQYDHYMAKNIIRPAVKTVETVIEEREKNQMIKTARSQYLTNGCEPVDYTLGKKETLIKNILFLGKDADLSFGDKAYYPDEPSLALKGVLCSDGVNMLILTENGDWYLMDEEYTTFIR